MIHSRTLWLVLAVLALATLLAPAVDAQPLACSAGTSSNPSIRAEGLAEIVSDIVITCTGGTPVASGPFPTVTITVSLNSPSTSRALSTGPTPLIEALLFIDDPVAASQAVCVSAACQNTDNVFQATLTQFNQITFSNIPLNPPGPTGQRLLRMKNVRVNATLLPVNGSVIALIGMTGPGAPATVANSQQNLATVRQTLGFDARSITDAAISAAPTFVACTGNNLDLATNNTAGYSTPGGRSMHLRYYEVGVTNAFRKRNAGTGVLTPGGTVSQDSTTQAYNTETGFYNAAFPTVNGLNRAGLADHGTRLRAQFTNIPANARLFVTVQEVTPGTTLSGTTPTTRAVLTTSPGTFAAIAADSAVDGGLKLVPASGEVVWEILETDPANLETVSFGVVIAFSANPQPAAGTATVAGTYAPGITAGDPIPRYGSLLSPGNAFTISGCRTTLLFQFITNREGFDTGIAITNTSRDTLGTPQQSGRCTATFFPTPSTPVVPPLSTPANLPAGEQWTFTLSGSRANFQGYMVVTCDFQFAHGFAFISDLGSQRLSHGYQALVIPDRVRVADPMSTAGAGSGEQLIH